MTEISLNSISDFDSSWREFIFMLSTFVSVVKFMCMDHLVRQTHESVLDGTCSCSDAIDCDVELN